MFVVDKVVDEDRQTQGPPTDSITALNVPESETTLPGGTTRYVGPSAQDAFSVFEDLCLLANSEKPHFLKLEFLHKTFALELIESVLTNYHDLFRKVVSFNMLAFSHSRVLREGRSESKKQTNLSIKPIIVNPSPPRDSSLKLISLISVLHIPSGLSHGLSLRCLSLLPFRWARDWRRAGVGDVHRGVR
jgi:hypothetical protein